MRDIPIIFSATMVKALLAGNKTMTRRLAWRHRVVCDPKNGHFLRNEYPPSPWQKVKPGDRLWVRENLTKSQAGWIYSADDRLIEMSPRDSRVAAMVAWAHHREQDYTPSIHMPRWASRLTLIVTATKTELVQDITMEDMIAEGLTFRPIGKAEHTIAAAMRVCDELEPKWEALWRKLNGDVSWNANPEVIALTFTVHNSNVDQLAKAA